jgi:mono/diheme cytochrome c family protein
VILSGHDWSRSNERLWFAERSHLPHHRANQIFKKGECMRRLFGYLIILGAIVGVAMWFASAPRGGDPALVADLKGDATQGELVFHATGCASCHMALNAKGDAQLVLSGGQRFATAFGTFIAPNISPDPVHGIGGWPLSDLVNAIKYGVSPAGQHYFPALPYGAYTHMELQDIADLQAYMATLPPDATPSEPHEVSFPFNIRRAVGVWKLLYLRSDWAIDGTLSPAETRGRYIAEAMAHCGECHTPRNALGGPDRSRWMAGGPNPSGEGRIPNITPAKLTWSEAEIVEYLTSGFTPEFDTVGGHMVHVVENMARLPESDRAAVAAYLKKVPPVE